MFPKEKESQINHERNNGHIAIGYNSQFENKNSVFLSLFGGEYDLGEKNKKGTMGVL